MQLYGCASGHRYGVDCGSIVYVVTPGVSIDSKISGTPVLDIVGIAIG